MEKQVAFPKGAEEASEAVKNYAAELDDPRKALYWKFTMDFGIMYDRFMREWCEHCITELEGMRDANSAD